MSEPTQSRPKSRNLFPRARTTRNFRNGCRCMASNSSRRRSTLSRTSGLNPVCPATRPAGVLRQTNSRNQRPTLLGQSSMVLCTVLRAFQSPIARSWIRPSHGPSRSAMSSLAREQAAALREGGEPLYCIWSNKHLRSTEVLRSSPLLTLGVDRR